MMFGFVAIAKQLTALKPMSVPTVVLQEKPKKEVEDIDKFRFIVGLLSIAVALVLIVQVIPSLIELNKLCEWTRQFRQLPSEIAQFREILIKTLVAFVIQFSFFISLGILLIRDAQVWTQELDSEEEFHGKSDKRENMTQKEKWLNRLYRYAEIHGYEKEKREKQPSNR